MRSRKKKMSNFRKFIIFVLIIILIVLCIKYYKKPIGENDLDKVLTSEQVKEVKASNDTKLASELVSTSDFKKTNFDRYLKYSKETNLSSDVVVKLVNNDIDELEDFVYDDIILSLLDEEYYLYKNTIRYMNYHKENKSLKASAIITDVNSNIDYDFYTHTKETDLSKGNLILVNKYNYLDEDYEPDLVAIDSEYGDWGYLSPVAYEAFKVMVAGAAEDGIELFSCSPYRSYELQSSLYNRYGQRDGYDEADTYSARPGFSEHQTGLAIDINAADDWFNDTAEAKWLANNAYKYGFILRYPKGKEYLTGYQYESWHYRYVGKDVAKYIYEHDITFEEYYAYFIDK